MGKVTETKRLLRNSDDDDKIIQAKLSLVNPTHARRGAKYAESSPHSGILELRGGSLRGLLGVTVSIFYGLFRTCSRNVARVFR